MISISDDVTAIPSCTPHLQLQLLAHAHQRATIGAGHAAWSPGRPLTGSGRLAGRVELLKLPLRCSGPGGSQVAGPGRPVGRQTAGPGSVGPAAADWPQLAERGQPPGRPPGGPALTTGSTGRYTRGSTRGRAGESPGLTGRRAAGPWAPPAPAAGLTDHQGRGGGTGNSGLTQRG